MNNENSDMTSFELFLEINQFYSNAISNSSASLYIFKNKTQLYTIVEIEQVS